MKQYVCEGEGREVFPRQQGLSVRPARDSAAPEREAVVGQFGLAPWFDRTAKPNWETGKIVWWKSRRADGQLWGLAGLWNTCWKTWTNGTSAPRRRPQR